MKYFTIALLLPCFAFAGSDIDTNTNLNKNVSVGYVNNSTNTTKGNRVVAGADSPVNIPTSDCMGGISAGGQGQYLGLSLGFSKQSKPCNIREYAKMLSENPIVAKAILCQDKIVKDAYEIAGQPCLEKPPVVKLEYPSSAGRN